MSDFGRHRDHRNQGPVTADYIYSVDPVADGVSRVSLTADVTTSGGMKVPAPVIRSAIARADSGQLARFKAFVEHATTS
jgi:hypothetical protein